MIVMVYSVLVRKMILGFYEASKNELMEVEYEESKKNYANACCVFYDGIFMFLFQRG